MRPPSSLALWRFYQLTAPFVTVAAAFTLIAVLATQWMGPWFGAVLAGVGSFGSFIASALSHRAQGCAQRLGGFAHWAVSGMWVALFALVAAALFWRWPVWVTLALALGTGAFTGWVSVFRRQAAATWQGNWVRLAGPTSRVGATLGAAAGAVLAANQWWVAFAAILLLPLSSPLSFAPLRSAASGGKSVARGHFVRNAAFALFAVGPVAAMPSLVTATAGPEWVGPAMAAYAAGAIASPYLIYRFPRTTPRGLPGFLLAAALANASWLLLAASPVVGLLASRALSGVVLFAAEGSADLDAAGEDSFGPAVSGRSLAVAVAGLSTGALLGLTGSVLATTTLLAVLSGMTVIALRLLGPRPRTVRT